MNMIKLWNKLYLTDRWSIGFIEDSIENIIETKNSKPKIHWINNPYNDRFFADPFILNILPNGNIEVLVEELVYIKAKGVITKLTISRTDYSIIKREVLIEEKTHLSYPYIERKSDAIYIYPESCEDNALYRYNLVNGKVKDKTSILNLPLCDTTIFEKNNKYLFATLKGETQDSVMRLFIYNNEKYQEHPQSPIKNNLRGGRPAGNIVVGNNGNSYLVSQDSSKSYGGAIIIYQIESITNDTYIDREIMSLIPDPNGYAPNGLHTINGFENLTVVDGIRPRKFYPILKIIFVLRNTLRRL